MGSLNLEQYNIKGVEDVYHNISYDELFRHETDSGLTGYEKGVETDLGAVAVDTGIFTGRSPKDKYIVLDENTKDTVWWAGEGRPGSDNKPISKETWQSLLALAQEQLSGKKLYVTDAYCGANENTRIKVRVITEVAWMSHFVKNMFIRPSDEELENFEPDFVMLNACKTSNPNYKEQGLNSEVFAAFNLTDKMAVVGGTWYGGEIKKGFFSVMNYFLPLQGIASMHCSANMGKEKDTAIFFGLSGTGKTTLSADPDRLLIGDDETGWDDEGIFNFEGGCYAKTINLNKDKEPDIYNAIRRNALLENVVLKNGNEIDFDDASKTENTRVSYPIDHIPNIVKPVSKGASPKNVIFLTADAFGVLPPVARLTKDQAMYHFLSGYTAKLAGTERGVTEPQPTFSAAFGAAFLLLHPTKYALELSKKMEQNGSVAYLVNTGWIGGLYGKGGNRIDISASRAIISAILNHEFDNAEFETMPIFNLNIPKEVSGVDSNLLNPRNSWQDKNLYDETAKKLAGRFIENFKTFTDTEEGKRLVAAGPTLDN